MTARRTTRTALVFIAACGSGHPAPNGGHDDAAPGTSGDAQTSTATTDVTGSLSGAAFSLKYGAVKRAVSGDPRNWVCAATAQVTFAECQSTTGSARTMFLGAFVYDTSGTPKWDIAETALYRVGSDPVTEFARSGSLSVAKDDAETGALQLTLTVDFGEIPTTTGSVVVTP